LISVFWSDADDWKPAVRSQVPGGRSILEFVKSVTPSLRRRDAILQEIPMGSSRRKLIIPLLLISCATGVQAGDGKHGRGAAQTASPKSLTGKERLGPKWTDEQRIDNCNVPVDRRGNKPRPSLCVNAPPS
jgi:hypothetical protein